MTTRRNLSIYGLAAAALLAIGAFGGMFIPQDGIRSAVNQWMAPQNDDADTEDAPAESSNVFEVSMAAQEAYGLKVARIDTAPFVESVRVPAFVRERPAVSNLQAATRLRGIVRKIFVVTGQSVCEGDPLVELELTGDELASSQSALLDSVKQLENVDAEVRRLESAASDGGIARRRIIEEQYKQRELRSRIESRSQELLIRGLSESEVHRIIKGGKLIRSIVTRVPVGIQPTVPPPREATRGRNDVLPISAGAVDDWAYSIEELHVSPGTVVDAGAPICNLAYHEMLIVEGQAYERDLPRLTRLIANQIPVSIELGDDDHPVRPAERPVLYMDNHVDNESQTYRFYVELQNEMLTENVTADGTRFRAWKFKPGQRGHIFLPGKPIEGGIPLPADAVVEDGIEHVVFERVAHHDHFHGDEGPHSEFRPIVIRVIYEDRDTVVAAADDLLKPGARLAMNNAGMLLRAKDAAAGGGGGHGHSHHGHEH